MNASKLIFIIILSVLLGLLIPRNSWSDISFEEKSKLRLVGTYTHEDTGVIFDLCEATEKNQYRSIRISNLRDDVLLDALFLANGKEIYLRVMNSMYEINMVPKGKRRSAVIKEKGNRKEFSNFLKSREILLLPALSHELGRTYGVNGRDYPVSLPMHILALNIARLAIRHPTIFYMPRTGTEGDIAERMCKGGEGSFCRKASCITADGKRGEQDLCCIDGECVQICSPCIEVQKPSRGISPCVDLREIPCHDCLGMCGAKCTCWDWVCYNCCCNKGCLAHDKACDRCGWRHPWDCIRCLAGDLGAPLFSCGGCNGCGN